MQLRGDRNQCPTCHEYFNSSAAFDKHRTREHGIYNRKTQEWDDGNRRCLSVGEMTQLGMLKNEAGFWVTEKRPEKGPRSPGGNARTHSEGV